MQDVMNLDEKAKMNTPSSTTGNWKWRLKEIPVDEVEAELAELTQLYNR